MIKQIWNNLNDITQGMLTGFIVILIIIAYYQFCVLLFPRDEAASAGFFIGFPIIFIVICSIVYTIHDITKTIYKTIKKKNDNIY